MRRPSVLGPDGQAIDRLLHLAATKVAGTCHGCEHRASGSPAGVTNVPRLLRFHPYHSFETRTEIGHRNRSQWRTVSDTCSLSGRVKSPPAGSAQPPEPPNRDDRPDGFADPKGPCSRQETVSHRVQSPVTPRPAAGPAHRPQLIVREGCMDSMELQVLTAGRRNDIVIDTGWPSNEDARGGSVHLVLHQVPGVRRSTRRKA